MILKFRQNRVRRAYFGGKRIDRFYGKQAAENGRMPEEWIASTVEAFNPDCTVAGEGLSVCQDGRLFRAVLEEDPVKILGQKLAAEHGGKLSILVKLLDSAERLVIQCHPTVPFAKERFGKRFGKTECWYMLDCAEQACVYLGFKPGITREMWIELFEKQDAEGMLNCLHRFPVKNGDLWFVGGGVPHAIGGGCLMVELQEPSDLMVIPERVTPAGITLAEEKLHGGLGFDGMFDCFVYEGLTEAETRKRYYRSGAWEENVWSPIVGRDLTDCFCMAGLRVCGETAVDLKERYGVVVVTDGAGMLEAEGITMTLCKSDSFFVTAGSGSIRLRGKMDLVFCTP